MATQANSQEDDQTTEDGDPKTQLCQQDSAYGSLESSSNGQSQKSFSGSGSKSLNSGSSHSSGFGDQSDFKGIRLHDAKHISLRKNKSAAETKVELTVKNLNESQSVVSKESSATRDSEADQKVKDVIIPKEETVPGNESCYSIPMDSCCEEREGSQTSLVYTQALNYIRKIKERSAEQGVPFASPYLDHLTTERQDIADLFKSYISNRGFTVAISIQDGSVLQVSSSITDILGFPKDMLLGQSFIDFVYPKDSINFSSKIINGLNIPMRNSSITVSDNYGTTFFCRLRMYHALKSTGYGVRNKKTLYKPCKIIFKSQDKTRIPESSRSSLLQFSLIIAEIIPIESAYTNSDESSTTMGSFSIRHSASCNFSEYDPEAIPYLGHLPQDLTGNSIFECYHPEDMKKLKSIYEEIVKYQGKPYRSEPYRFRTFNNSWVTLLTEWLCFVNPWTKRIESIIGQHRVLKGPKDEDVFVDPTDKNLSPLPEEILLEAQTAQSEILDLLSKPVTSYQDPSKEPMVKRRRTLADIMSPFVEELDNIEKKNSIDGHGSNLNISCNGNKRNVSISLASEVPINPGMSMHKTSARHCQSGITPGQESLNSSIETPSSYGQLNYSATLQRFFRSNPKTVSSDESGESKMEASHQESIGFSTSGSANRKSQSQSQSQSGSGSGSGDNNCDSNRVSIKSRIISKYQPASFPLSSPSSTSPALQPMTLAHTSLRTSPIFRKSNNTKIKFSKNEGNSEELFNEERSYMLPLTEEILSKHNQNMQKQFMECQRKNERIISSSKYDHNKVKTLKKLSKKARERSYGMKKSGNAKVGEGSGVKQAPAQVPNTNSNEPTIKPSLLSSTDNTSIPPNVSKLERTFHSPLLSRQPSDLPDGRPPNNEGQPSFSRVMPNYFQPSNTIPKENIGQNGIPSSSMPGAPSPFSAAPPLMMAQPTYFQSQMPVQYMGGLPGMFYQPIGPPLFNAPPVMLPNLVFQHTLIQPSVAHHLPVPGLSDDRKYTAESEHDTGESHLLNKQTTQNDKQIATLRRPDSQATSVKAEPGSIRGSNASASCKVNAAESIRSYVDDLSMLQNIPLSKQDRSQTPNFSQVSQFSQSTSVIAELESIRSPEKQENKTPEDNETRNYNSSDMILSMDSSSSPSYDKSGNESPGTANTLHEEDEQAEKENALARLERMKEARPFLKEPQWIEGIRVTPELLLRYQLQTNELVDVLRQDMDLLKRTKQPSCVDEQLASLYCELELDGENPELHLEEGITTSSSSDDQQGPNARHHSFKEGKRRLVFYSKMSMLHEEEAPMPASHEFPSS